MSMRSRAAAVAAVLLLLVVTGVFLHRTVSMRDVLATVNEVRTTSLSHLRIDRVAHHYRAFAAIDTESDSEKEIRFSEGSTAALLPSSRIELSSDRRSLRLDRGAIRLKASKESDAFRIQASDVEVDANGAGIVVAKTQGTVAVACSSGRISVRLAGSKPTVLSRGEAALISNSEVRLAQVASGSFANLVAAAEAGTIVAATKAALDATAGKSTSDGDATAAAASLRGASVRGIAGLVVDAGDHPISGARVHIQVPRPPGQTSETTIVDLVTTQSGQFMLGTGTAYVLVSVRAPGFAVSKTQRLATSLPPWSSPTVIKLFRSNQSIEGRVVDARGIGVPEAFVRAEGIEAITDEDGFFLLSAVTAVPDKVDVTAYKNGYRRAQVRQVPTSQQVELVLEPAIQVRCALFTIDGLSSAPVGGVPLEIRPTEPHVGTTVVTTDQNASATVTLEPGEYTVAVKASGWGASTSRVTITSSTAGRRIDVPVYPSARLRGRVIDGETSRPAAGIVVMSGSSRSMSDATGEFSIENLPVGGYVTITVDCLADVGATAEGVLVGPERSHDGRLSFRVRWPEPVSANRNLGEVSGNVLLKPNRQLTAEVTVEGIPARFADVMVVDTTGTLRSWSDRKRTDQEGRVDLGHIPRCPVYYLYVWGDGLARRVIPLELSDLERLHGAPLSIDCDRGITLRGRVTNDRGVPVEGAWVAARSDLDRQAIPVPRYGRTNAAGEYDISNLARETTYTVLAMPTFSARLYMELRGQPCAKEIETGNTDLTADLVIWPGERKD